MSPPDLTAALEKSAREAGFALSGACPAVSPTGITGLARWLAAGHAGEMRYLSDRFDAYRHPRSVLDGVRSLLMLGMSYRTAGPPPVGAGEGRVSRYAWGPADYHDVVHRRLQQLCHVARQLEPTARVRGVVDTAPLLEREFGQMAGLGWVGRTRCSCIGRWGAGFFWRPFCWTASWCTTSRSSAIIADRAPPVSTRVQPPRFRNRMYSMRPGASVT